MSEGTQESRRTFLRSASTVVAGAALAGCATTEETVEIGTGHETAVTPETPAAPPPPDPTANCKFEPRVENYFKRRFFTGNCEGPIGRVLGDVYIPPRPVTGADFKIRGKNKHGENRVHPSTLVDHKRLYDKIDLMVYLLDGISYLTLYGKSATPVGVLMRDYFLLRAAGAVKDKRLDAGKWAKMKPVMEQFVKEFENSPLSLRKIYLCEYEDQADVQRAVVLLQEIYRQSDNFLCFPFAFYTVNEACLDDFLDKFGTFDLLQIYTLSKDESRQSNGQEWDELRVKYGAMAWKAMNHPFLNVPSEDIFLGPPSDNMYDQYPDLQKVMLQCNNGNDRDCGNNDCGTIREDCFCNVAENGGCSIGSCCPD